VLVSAQSLFERGWLAPPKYGFPTLSLKVRLMLVDPTQPRGDRNADLSRKQSTTKADFRTLVQTVLNDEQESCWTGLPRPNREEQIFTPGRISRTCVRGTEMPQSDLKSPGRES
jgi:hypothetical protein